jgi:hypothetical protein
MPALNQTLTRVSDLLGMLSGIAVHGATLSNGRAHFEISATGAAIDPLQQMTLGANVLLEPWRHPTDAAQSTQTKYMLIASTTTRDAIEFGELQLLGVHLVWHLHHTGALTTPDANALLSGWHGVAVGA